jgi:hypothetical protein
MYAALNSCVADYRPMQNNHVEKHDFTGFDNNVHREKKDPVS